MSIHAFAAALLPVVLLAQAPADEKPTAEGLEFFETRIRPVLANNCYGCHSVESKIAMGGLYLDSRPGARSGGRSGPAVTPGKPEASLILGAIRYKGRQMPPSGKLPDSVADDFAKWVRMGAPDPRERQTTWKPSTIDIEKGRQYWAFQPPRKPPVPNVKDVKWSSQPIDRFLLAQMEKKGVVHVADAGRASWLRRVTFDLTGLPPRPEEIDSFVRDRASTAYAKVVDRLQASPRFGERWGRHWLDVARYAETAGSGRNYAFPFAWRYRNYVIDAFNRDKPYDQFVREQIAGDLLPAESQKQRNEQLIATGFLSIGSHDLAELNPAVFRMTAVDEQINATSRAFLGVTVGCARCHDHKFDPIPTADYYAMAGIFLSTEMLSGVQRKPRDNISYFNYDLLARLSLAPGEPAPTHLADPQKARHWDELMAVWRELKGRPTLPATGQGAAVQSSQVLLDLDKLPLPSDLVMAVRESANPVDGEILVAGDVAQPGPRVQRGFLQVVSKPGETFDIGPKESGRLQLAQWLTRRDNPLAARVMVNRIWHQLFGQGIVATVDNFGKMGEQPTHPELLDYLAVSFMDGGWSVKKTIREIVLSRAYRMSTALSDRNFQIDPDNKLYWRMNRRRLEVEAIRDSLLAIGGEIDLEPLRESPVLGFNRGIDVGRGRGAFTEDYTVTMRKRSVYVPVVRNFIPPMYETFDFPEPSETKGRREVTTVPTQALFLMNSPFVMEQSNRAGARLVKHQAWSDERRVRRVYIEVLGRAPTADELKRSIVFVRKSPSGWAELYQALFASAEFRYRG